MRIPSACGPIVCCEHLNSLLALGFLRALPLLQAEVRQEAYHGFRAVEIPIVPNPIISTIGPVSNDTIVLTLSPFSES